MNFSLTRNQLQFLTSSSFLHVVILCDTYTHVERYYSDDETHFIGKKYYNNAMQNAMQQRIIYI